MSCIEGTLRQIAADVEDQVKGALSGILTGVFVRGYLPQAWNVRTTEGEALAFVVDANGNAGVERGTARGPDVTIQGSHDVIAAALQGDRATVTRRQNEVGVKTHTAKGKAAWGYLRGRFGF